MSRIKKLLNDDRAQAGGRDLPGVIIMLGVGIVAGFLVITIASETVAIAGLSSGDPLYNSSQSMVDASNNVFSMLGIVFLAVILSVVVFYLYGVTGRR
jgi:hypothetical protein